MNLRQLLLKSVYTTIITCLFTLRFQAQDVVIHFNDKGKVYGDLPEKLLSTQKLKYYVSGDKNPSIANENSLKDRAEKALFNINKIEADPDKMALLQLVYGIKDFADIRNDLTKIKDSPVQLSNTTYVPALPDIANYYSIKLFPSSNPQFSFGYNSQATDGQVCKPTDGKSLNVYLYQTDLFKKIVYDWYAAKTPEHKITPGDLLTWQNAAKQVTNYIMLVKPLTDQAQKIIDDFDKLTPAKKHRNLDLSLNALGTLTTKAAKFHQTISDTLPILQAKVSMVRNKDWILHWIWYQNSGLPQLNPFPFVTNETLGPEPDTSENPILRIKIQTREDFIKNADYKTVPKELVDDYIDDIVSYRKAITLSSAGLKKYQDQKKTNVILESDFTQNKLKLNDLLLYVSTPKKSIYWMRHHDASDDATIMDVDMATEYLETDRIVILTHNLTKDQKATVQLSFAPITTDNSQFGEQVDNVLKQVSSYNILHAPGGGTRQDRLINAAIGNFLLQTNLIEIDLKKLKIIGDALSYLVTQQNPETGLKENSSDSAVNHSEKKQSPQVFGPKLATYTIKVDKATPAAAQAASVTPPVATSPVAGVTITTVTVTSPAATPSSAVSGTSPKSTPAETGVGPVDTFHYRVNKKYRIFPMAGIAYTLNQFQDIANSTDASSPGKVSQEQQTRFIVGIKVFFDKEDIRNTRFCTGTDAYGRSLILTRLHFDAAVGITSPLSNIYVGMGLDLWPGVSINGGSVFNKYNYSDYVNGQNILNRTLYRTGFYVGLTTDVSVVADLLKLVNLSK